MRSNKYGGTCDACGSYVKAGEGNLFKAFGKYAVTHRTCPEPRQGVPRVTTTRFSSGAVVYQNSRGRCIDAPCCGCCS